MNQKYITIVIVVLFAAAAFIAGYFWRGTDDGGPSPTVSVSAAPLVPPTSTKTPVPSVAYTPVLHTVALTAQGPSPKTLTIRPGDAVRFRNEAAAAFWPASDPHPAHTQCPSLDAGRGLRTGEEYTLVFSTVTTCTYHNHLDPTNSALWGTITVR